MHVCDFCEQCTDSWVILAELGGLIGDTLADCGYVVEERSK